MSDTRLRELERRWEETGSPDDEAAYLLERVRVGDLTQERLELAAYCGHEGARRCTSTVPPRHGSEWLEGLVRWGRMYVATAALAIADQVIEIWENRPGSFLAQDLSPTLHERLSFLRRRLVQSGSDADIQQAAQQVDPGPGLPFSDWCDPESAAFAADAVRAALRCVAVGDQETMRRYLLSVGESATLALNDADDTIHPRLLSTAQTALCQTALLAGFSDRSRP